MADSTQQTIQTTKSREKTGTSDEHRFAKANASMKKAKKLQVQARREMAAAELLDERAKKRLKGIEAKVREQEKRFKKIMQAIVDYDGENRVAYAHRLARASLEGGTKITSIQWQFTTRILENPKITDFCRHCGINCYGEKPRPGAMPCNVAGCPFESPEKQRRGLTEAEVRRLTT